jgi:hypothetical protein
MMSVANKPILLSIVRLNVVAPRHHVIQHNETQHNDIQYNIK